MTRRLKLVIGLLVAAMISGMAQSGQDPLQHLETYRQQGIDRVDAQNGQRLWNSAVNERSCTSCHGDDPDSAGRHLKTGKVIQPMALSANPMRYQDARKIEKWFLRNCKWTFGRECDTQEKADILTWLSSQ